jgi:TonB family protein
MEANIVLYWLEVNVALMVFYLCYKFLTGSDTFFGLRRAAIVVMIVTAFVYPMVDVSGWFPQRAELMSAWVQGAVFELPGVVVSGAAQGTPLLHPMTLLLMAAGGIYCLGMVWLLFRTLREIGFVTRDRIRLPRKVVDGVEVSVLAEGQASYSFFHWIFCAADEHDANKLHQIVVHEKAHADQMHSLDVLIAEATCMVCWINPFAWLLRREMRLNHEYLADAAVLQNGFDRTAYGYLLVGIRPPQNMAIAKLYNHFNVLLLKKRIIMLNRTKTRSCLRWKYLTIVFAAAALLYTGSLIRAAQVAETPEAAPAAAVYNLSKGKKAVRKTDKVVVATQTVKGASKVSATNGEKVYDLVEEMPGFPGGMDKLVEYLRANVKYPEAAEKKGIQGRVTVIFVVTDKGEITKVQVAKGVNPALDAEALRVVKSMPKWKPGMVKGKAVNTKFSVPIVFRLNNEKNK